MPSIETSDALNSFRVSKGDALLIVCSPPCHASALCPALAATTAAATGGTEDFLFLSSFFIQMLAALHPFPQPLLLEFVFALFIVKVSVFWLSVWVIGFKVNTVE